MKIQRICIIVLCVMLLTLGTAQAEIQERHVAYFPLMAVSSPEVETMSDWKVIVPVATQNFITNPSFETGTVGWTNVGMTTFAQSSTFSKFGSYALRLIADATTDTADGNTVSEADAAETWTASCWVYVVAGDFELVIEENSGGWTEQGSIATTTTGEWVHLEVTVTFDGGVTDGRVVLKPNAVAASQFYVDAVQFEQQGEVTTFCDGDQKGCEWNGAAHASTSTRSALSRAGGFIRDFTDDYSFDISQAIGAGMAPVEQILDDFAILPGGQIQGSKIQARGFSLVGMIRGSSAADLHAKRAALIGIFEPSGIPNDQPFILRYTGAAVDKQISAYYEDGLSLSLQSANCWNERIALRFLAADPFWYELGESSDALDTNDTATTRYVAGRLRSTGQWDNLSLGANPTTGGTIHAITIGQDGLVYYGGTFTGMNGAAGRDYIASFDPQTDTWATVGAGSAVNDTVRAITIAPNGDVYIGGDFTNVGGAAGDYVAYYDISGGAWAPVAAGGVADVFALAFGHDGTLYIGGTFQNWGDANGDYIVSFTGGAYVSLSTGMDGPLRAIVVDLNGDIIIAGTFSATLQRVARWDGLTFSAIGPGFNGDCYALAVGQDGTIYASGLFTTTDGGAANALLRIAQWTGGAWSEMAGGLGSTAQQISIAPNGDVWIVGAFSTAGDLTVEGVVKWEGTSWAQTDLIPNMTTQIRGLTTGRRDPVIADIYEVYIGWDNSAVSPYGGAATIANGGTQNAAPKFVIMRTGGTTAKLISIRDELTGKELFFDYDLLDGETLTIDLAPTAQSIVSDFSGARPDAALANSDIGSFTLLPGDNPITVFIDVSGAPTITAFLIHRATFWSID